MKTTKKVWRKKLLCGIFSMVLVFGFLIVSPAFAFDPPLCETCGGQGTLPCRNCGGKGKVITDSRKCKYSNVPVYGPPVRCLDGILSTGFTEKGVCPQCEGTGTINEFSDCPKCGGNGQIDCPPCQGTGYSFRN
jgi:DnaJ-class molecular chaperone